MDTCGDCEYYDPINEIKGYCTRKPPSTGFNAMYGEVKTMRLKMNRTDRKCGDFKKG